MSDDEQISTLKRELRERKSELQRPEATSKAQYVALVEKGWFKLLVVWMNSKHGEFPGPITNHILCKNGKLDPTKRFKRDFAAISVSIYDRLADFFQGGPKIVRPYVLAPGTDAPVFIMEPITLSINVDGRVMKKVVDPHWKVGSVRNQLCATLKLSKNKSRFIVGRSEEVAGDTWEIGESVDQDEPSLTLQIDPEARGQEYTRFKTFENAPLKVITTTEKTSAFLPCVECLLNVRPLTDFVLAQGFENQINIENKRGSRGVIAKAFLALARERVANSSETQNISANALKDAIIDKYPDLLDYGRFDADETLAALLDGLIEDTNRAPANPGSSQIISEGSPIADIFLGTLRGSLECPLCNQFEEIKERFLFLSLPVPEFENNKEANLLDCIAHFSITEKIPDGSRVKCPYCKKLAQSFKTLAVDICPEILIISFKRPERFLSLSSSSNNPVSYPDEIDVASFASSSSGIYKLVCVLFQQGTYDDDKYSCAVLNQEINKWTYISKNKALFVDITGAHNGDAKILFYQKSN